MTRQGRRSGTACLAPLKLGFCTIELYIDLWPTRVWDATNKWTGKSTASASTGWEVLAACNRAQRHRQLVTARKAGETLGCHPKTVERYAKRGLLTVIRFSARKLRYDLDEVEAFANDGLNAARSKDGGK